MSRTNRLLDLLQLLRGYRYPVAGQVLAETLGISLRTLYRDIQTLQAQGADIEGEPGLGYVLKPGFMLPPLMFTREEIEALMLGSNWVSQRTDERLAEAAKQALAKITHVLPSDLKDYLSTSHLILGPAPEQKPVRIDLSLIRQAIRQEEAIAISYTDERGHRSEREIWPFGMGFFEQVRVILAWCTLRNSFRHFRADRIEVMAMSGRRYPRRRMALLKEWKHECRNEATSAR